MRKTIISSLAVGICLSLCGAAFAAKAHKPPPAPAAPQPPPAPSWTGAYVGVNAGYSWGRSNSNYFTIDPVLLNSESHSDTARINGAIGGGQIGYNYQFSPSYVAGIEADIQASGERGGNTVQVCHAGGAPGAACDTTNAFDTYKEKLLWFGTVRGRLGFLANAGLLVYATGGLAYGELERTDNYTFIDTGVFCNIGGPTICTPQSNSIHGTRAGLTAGGGLEGRLVGNWTGRIEYLYMELAGLGTTTVILNSPNPPVRVTTTSHIFTDNILRVGLNYKWP